MPKNIHATSVQRREAVIQPAFVWRDRSAAMAKAKGMAMPVKPK